MSHFVVYSHEGATHPDTPLPTAAALHTDHLTGVSRASRMPRRRPHRALVALFALWFVVAAFIGDPGAPASASFLPSTSPAASSPVQTTAVSGAYPPTLAVASTHRCPQYEGLLRAYSPGWDVARMSALMWRESRCTPTAHNRRTHDFGALQIHWRASYARVPMRTGFGTLTHECGISSPYELLDITVNIRCAAVLYRAFGYSPWRVR